MNMTVLLKMARVQTLVEVCDLLITLRQTAPAPQQKQVDDMICRLNTMAETF